MKVTLFRDLPTERWWSMERYADELARALQQIGCDARSYVAARPLPQLRGVPSTLANYAWRTTAYPLVARFHQGEVNHIVDHSYAHLIHALDARRTVVTCHDLAPLALDAGRGIGRWLWDRSFRAMQRAAHVIAVSEYTRAEILRFTKYPRERITVIPEAASAEFFEPVMPASVHALRERYGIAGRIILHIGTCAPRKNVEVTVYAMSELRNRDLIFVQVGGIFSPPQLKLINALSLETRVKQLAPVPENELRLWYHTADVFVFPSTYEGFGMPVIEAMASGAPVICANVGALPQVAGDAAILIDPREPAKLAGAIRSVLDDATLAADLRARGSVRARQFTWERTARETLAVYQKIER